MIRYSVTLPPRVLAGLRRETGAAAPAECCGALIGLVRGHDMEVRTLIPVPNEAHAAATYHIDAEVVLRLERQAASTSQQVIGFYHSHPATSAEPSATDLELAAPGYVYLIVDGRAGEIRCWRLRDDRSGFTELPISLLAGAA
ncbi:MAG TPA: M67 family metallopeptidase [Longimicrobiales bacterium]